LSSKDKDPILGEPIPEVHDYDTDESTLDIRALGEALETTAQQHVEDAVQAANEEERHEQTDDKSTDEQDPINVRIRNSPIYISPTIRAQLINTFDRTFKQSQGGRGGGGGLGGPGGPPALLPPPPHALIPVPAAADMRAMGNKPENFYGDRAKADTFIEDVKAYLRLNEDVTGYNSPKNKITFTLTCMKGDKVSRWTRAMGKMLDTLPRDQNIPLLWDFFL
jgi:hypothetical protein